jgi:O-succinylbenzoic acid--CoA ligase
MPQNEPAFQLSKICARYASRTALLSDNHGYTYREFYEYILIVSTGLRQIGIGKKDRIALISGNSVYLPLLILALFNVGAVAVPVNFRIPAAQIGELLDSIGCRKVFIAKKYVNQQAWLSLSPVPIENFFSGLKKTKFETEAVTWPLRQTATVIFTSGSTGYPKAAVHTIGNHYYNALGSNENIRLRPGDRWLLTLPLFHVGGLAILFRTLLAGATCVIAKDGKKIGKVIRDRKITHLSLVATQLFRLLAQPRILPVLRNLKTILLGGGPAADSLIDRAVKSRLPLYLSYGLTEMASQVTTTKRVRSYSGLKANHAGKVLKYRRLKISDKGEILIKGLTLFKGYWKEQRIYRALDRDGWFHSGDLGYLDSRGNLVVNGRRDTMFISGGENIYPEEIEQQLRNIKEVKDALIVPVSDKEFGQRPVAFIQVVKGRKIKVGYLRFCLQKKMAGYKIPQLFFPWPEEYVALKPGRQSFKIKADKLFVPAKNKLPDEIV